MPETTVAVDPDLSSLNISKTNNPEQIRVLIHNSLSATLLYTQLCIFKNSDKLHLAPSPSEMLTDSICFEDTLQFHNSVIDNVPSMYTNASITAPTQNSQPLSPFDKFSDIFYAAMGLQYSDKPNLMNLYEKIKYDLSKNFKQIEKNLQCDYTNDFIKVTELVNNEVQKWQSNFFEVFSRAREREHVKANDIFKLQKTIEYVCSATSRSLINYFFMLMLTYTEPESNLQKSLLMCNFMDGETRLYQHAIYFNELKHFSDKYDTYKLLYQKEKMSSRLKWYFFLQMINPRLPSHHPIVEHSCILAGKFADDICSTLPSTVYSVLDKVFDYEIELMSHAINKLGGDVRAKNRCENVNFSFEFCVSAALLFPDNELLLTSQNSVSLLLDLYKISIGTFGSGMMSIISTLMENSFHNAMKVTEQQHQCKNLYLHLARAHLRSKISDWNGVYYDLELIKESDIVQNCYYADLQHQYTEAMFVRESALDEKKQMKYLYDRSYLCLHIGEFESVSSTELWGSEKCKRLCEEYLPLFLEKVKCNENLSIWESLTNAAHYFKACKMIASLNETKASMEDRIRLCLKIALDLVETDKSYNQIHQPELYNLLRYTKTSLELMSKSYEKNLTKDLPETSQAKHQLLDNLADFAATIDETNVENDEKRTTSIQPLDYSSLPNYTKNLAEISLSGQQVSTNLNQSQQDNNNMSNTTNGGNDTSGSISRDTCTQTTIDASTQTTIDTSTQTEVFSDSGANNTYNILSMDGGGIRGIFQIVILMEIERRTGKRIRDLFDCFAGTSTGGILACGLAKNEPMTTQNLLRLYLGPSRYKIFQRRFLHPLGWLFYSKYSPKGIEHILAQKLPIECLTDCGMHDLIVTTEIANGTPGLFVNNSYTPTETGLYYYSPNNQLNMFSIGEQNNCLLRDVARCSSAAAPLFPPKKLNLNGKSYTFYDGGYRFNQPDKIALHWATNKRSFTNDQILLVSLGNSNTAPVPIPMFTSTLHYLLKLAELNEVIGFQNPDNGLKEILRDRYIRISPSINNSVALDATDPVSLRAVWEAAWQTIKDMDRDSDTFNQLCIQLLKRKGFPSTLIGIHPPPKSVQYFPSRHMRMPEEYDALDILFMNKIAFDKRHQQLPKLLQKFYRNQLSSAVDKLHCPMFSMSSSHAPLSIAAAIGHVPSLLHYLIEVIEHIGRPLTVQEANERAVDGTEGWRKWYWNALHYAAANGEIESLLVLLYAESINRIQLTATEVASDLRRMKELLDKKTWSLFSKYSPAELANTNRHFHVRDYINAEARNIDDRLSDILRRVRHN